MDRKDVDATGRAVVLNKMFPKEDAIRDKGVLADERVVDSSWQEHYVAYSLLIVHSAYVCPECQCQIEVELKGEQFRRKFSNPYPGTAQVYSIFLEKHIRDHQI
jgi:hypothetical protein